MHRIVESHITLKTKVEIKNILKMRKNARVQWRQRRYKIKNLLLLLFVLFQISSVDAAAAHLHNRFVLTMRLSVDYFYSRMNRKIHNYFRLNDKKARDDSLVFLFECLLVFHLSYFHFSILLLNAK